ncbi:peptidoglycan DD-metalloendopeptidase family protein [Thalassotalea sp. LPB0316]|uniref:murein hydrolase activator EnvC family protein n=1 Tax=Thalassotalea sp. LPB0316 TaxID=2769490 RepID=UPI001869382A|nr:peptidoglycan DD-metalloendopeptidase family protein [Thalassotalea sp. LPB0316]QOL26513.1 peptidoglycan DD-metalloendopeptidase family protein [Thalassotalea sp. LPB0316]
MLRLKAFLLMLALGSTSYLMPVSVLADDKSVTNEQLNEVKKAIAKQQAALNASNKQRDTILRALKRDDIAIAKAAKALNKTEQSLTETSQKLVELKKQQKNLTQQKQKQEALLAQQLRAAYSSGQHDYLKLLLNQEKTSDIQRTLKYYQYLNDARIAEIEAFQKTIEQLVEVTSQYQAQSEKLNALKVTQIAQQQELKEQKAQRAKSVAKLNKSIESSSDKLERLKREEESLVAALAEIEKLARAEAELEGLSQLKHKLTWPVNGKHLNRFGSKKQGYLKWKGIMIETPVGRTVSTIHSGTVLFADWLKGYGLVIVVDHGDGYMSLYGHNQTLLKNVGDRVESGEPISLAGQSGGRVESGLYFEIRHKGQAVNPRLWCR